MFADERITALGAALSAALMVGGADAQQRGAALEDCHVGNVSALASCGTLEVPEDWNDPDGKSITLSFAVLPPSGGQVEHPPLYLLAGGPGQAATEQGLVVDNFMRPIREGREVVLVDQRGTGGSAPFTCNLEDLSATASGTELARRCMEDLPGEPQNFTSASFMQDLDAVMAVLGHGEVDLWGGSYGTRAALLFVRSYPERVRAMVLDAVAPPDIQIFQGESSTFDSALRRTLEDCEADEACSEAFPRIEATFERLKGQLDQEPQQVRMGGETIEVDGGLFSDGLRGALYAPQTAAMIPFITAQAADGNFDPWTAIGEGGFGDGINAGLLLSVQCAEEAPRYRAEKSRSDLLFVSTMDRVLAEACDVWPAADYPDGFEEPVESDVPTLLLSGALDPITPPSNAESAARTLTNSRSLTAPSGGHIITTHGCTADLIAEFLDTLDLEALDGSCLSEISRPPFVVSKAGPRP